MIAAEKVVQFSVNAKTHYGILHVPSIDSPNNRIGVNILCPGTKHRVGPHRLNVKLARRLCSFGYYVFRFDPQGVGDSEGELKEGLLSKAWSQIQRGLFVEDTIIANGIFAEMAGVEKITLLGLCGGAVTAILTAEKDAKVDNVVAIDVPITISDFEERKYDEIITSKTYADNLFKMYLRKAFAPKAWARLLTFQTDYKAMLKVLRFRFASFWGESSPGKKEHSRNFNLALLEAFQNIHLVGKHVLFIGAEKEYTRGEFEEEFLPCIQMHGESNSNWDYHVVKDSNHVYSHIEWQHELEHHIIDWMKKAYI